MSEHRLDRIEKNLDRIVEKVDSMAEVVTATGPYRRKARCCVAEARPPRLTIKQAFQ